MKHKIKRKWVQSDNAEGGGGGTHKKNIYCFHGPLGQTQGKTLHSTFQILQQIYTRKPTRRKKTCTLKNKITNNFNSSLVKFTGWKPSAAVHGVSHDTCCVQCCYRHIGEGLSVAYIS